MESYIEFNVSLNGYHLFATAPRSFPASQPWRAEAFYKTLTDKFPVEEGYHITVCRWDCVGHQVMYNE